MTNPIPTPEPLSGEDQKKILSAADPWSRDRAYQIVRSDWAYAESYRTNAHDWRYRNADELYLGWAGQRYWEGTRVPRSSLGSYVVFQQVEAMLPRIVPQASSFDNLHFKDQNGAGDESTSPEVMAHRAHILHRLESCKLPMNLRRVAKGAGIYGNGIMEWGWEEREETSFTFEQVPIQAGSDIVAHPTLGPISVPRPAPLRLQRKKEKVRIGQPYLRYVSAKDCYVDPNCESLDLSQAAYFIKRVYMTAQAVKALAKQPDFDVPDDEYLQRLSVSKSTANQDVTKEAVELFRYNQWNPSLDYSSDPSNKRIAVIEYTTPSRKIWWLQGGEDGRSIIYNQHNRYEKINYLAWSYADVMDRWHGLGISDVAEGEQRFQAATINARIDELALAMHRPMIKRRGVTIPAYQLKVRPGQVIEAENPDGDIKQGEVMNITQQAYIEVQASDQRVQRTTGMSDLAAMGTPSPGGNSANRTAMGVNVQATATDTRSLFLLMTLEQMVVEPLVNNFIEMERRFLDPNLAAAWLKLDSRFSSLDPVKVLNTHVVCRSRGAVRQAARMGFLQVFPLLAQTFLNPGLLAHLAQNQHKTINAEEMMRMLMDAINYSPRNPLLVDMTPQQVQEMNAPPPEVALKTQLAQQRGQTDEQINDKRLIAKLVDTLLKQGFQHHGRMESMDHDHESAVLNALLSSGQSAEPDTGEEPNPGAGGQV